MTARAVELLAHLHGLGVELSAAQGKLQFRAPPGALTPALRAELAAHKPALLALLDAPAPLSDAQERFWFLTQLSPGSAAYNITARLRLDGALDRAALARALSEIVRRHDTLRTAAVRSDDGRTIQRIAPPGELALAVVDLRALAPAARLAEQQRVVAEAARQPFDLAAPPHLDLRALAPAARLAEQERVVAEAARQPFDLAAPPHLRATLVQLDDAQHLLVLVTHHFAADGWSMAVLLRELGALYAAFCAGRPSPLPPLGVRYAGLAAEQRRRAARGELAGQLAHWTAALAGAPPALELPTDFPRPAVQTGRGSAASFALPAALGDALRALARREGATLFMTLLTGFQALLHRLTGQDDLVVATAVSQRARPEAEAVIAPLGNNLLIRAQFDGDPSFRALLRQTRDRCIAAYAHQDLPFERLLDALKPPRDLARSPLFQAMFVLHAGAPRLELPGLRATLEPVDAGTAKFDLELSMFDGPGELHGSLEYSHDLFTPETIARMIAQLERLLAAAAAAPDLAVSRLPLLSSAERRAIIVDWNATEVRYPDGSLHGLVEAQVARTPDAIAVEFEGTALTYRELDRRANQLAHALVARGVGRDVPVGICLERSLELVISLYAALKAGGAYLPLEPSYPPARLAAILTDARPPVVVTTANHRDRLGLGEALALDEQADALAGCDAGPAVVVSPDDLAYVLYTSGSTGAPKGVMIPHRGIVNRLLWMHATYGMTADDRVLQKTPFSFDVSLWEFFWPLLAGARLVVARPDGHRDSGYLAAVIAARAITTLHFVPTMLQVFLDEPALGACSALRRVFASGEALSPALAERCFARLGPIELHNLYGPTEASVDVSAWRCRPGAARVPIGTPIANTQLYILDRHLEPVPVGVAGDLFIGGVGLARGYLHKPELTRERFVPSPFQPGARIYRTGDVARYLPDGNIEYLGRSDHQVKLRGFRIELEEIAAALRQHPAVKDAVVTVRDDRSGERRLVAYVILDGGGGSPELRAFLHARLPEYMVPASFTALDAFPLTTSGKTDLKALPAPESLPTERDPVVAPRNPVERVLLDAFRAVLGSDEIGVLDDFFALGGDSILSIRIVARAAAAGLTLTPRQIFQHPTVARLAEIAAPAAGAEAEQGALTGPVPLTPIQRWFFARSFPAPHHWNQAFLIALRRAVDPVALERALRGLTAHHDALRLRFTRGPDGWAQHYADREDAALLRVLPAAPDAATHRAAVVDAAAVLQASLDLERGPLLGALVIPRLAGAAGDGVGPELLLVVHHLAVDGVSWRILLEDLEALLAGEERGAPAALPRKTASFRAWAEQLVRAAAAPELQAELPRWRALAAQASTAVLGELAASDDRGPAATCMVELGTEDTAALLGELARHRASPQDALVAALVAQLRPPGAPGLAVALEGHGREELPGRLDVSRTVGWFTSLYPAWIALDERAAPGEALRAVRDQLRAIPRGGVGFGVLRYLGDAPELAGDAEPRVLVNYLGRLDVVPDGSALYAGFAPPLGPLRSPRNHRSHALAVDACVVAGRLRIDLTGGLTDGAAQRGALAELAAQLAAALRELLTALRADDAPRDARPAPGDFPLARLTPAGLAAILQAAPDVEDIYPATPLQQHMLETPPAPGLYVMHMVLPLRGPLSPERLEQAWRGATDEHPILRTSFATPAGGAPVQVVHRRAALVFEHRDLCGQSAAEQDDALAAHLRALRDRGFSPSEAPQLRCSLLALADDDHRLVIAFSYRILDGWSFSRVLLRSFERYAALERGESFGPAAPPPYRDYIAWLAAQDPATAEAFWRTTLAGVRGPTPLAPAARPVPAGAAPYIKHKLALSTALSESLRAAARAASVTLNTLAQAAWALVLARRTGERDVVFGVTVSGRSAALPGIEAMVGSCIAILPLRAVLDPDAPLWPWLAALQAQQVELRQYEFTPLAQIQAWLGLPRDTLLFHSYLVFENFPVAPSLFRHAERLGIDETEDLVQTEHPLRLEVFPTAPITLTLSGYQRHFAPADLHALLDELRDVLTRLAELAHQPAGAAPRLHALLGPAARGPQNGLSR